jgi:hypothetical protein
MLLPITIHVYVMCIRRSLYLFYMITSAAASTVATKIWDSPFGEFSSATATIKRQKDQGPSGHQL